MNIAFSPCPNDTFVFYAWVHGKIKGAPPLEVTYADIDKTNYWAIDQTGPDVMKISYAALPYVLDHYQLIPSGGALGRGCGPLVLTKEKQSIKSLEGKTVAVPSDRSTAYLLFRLWTAQALTNNTITIKVMPFEKIMPAVKDGIVDAGLVIHEARFTYQEYDLCLLQDLGEWWEEDTGFPIPLGAIIAKRSLSKEQFTHWATASVEYAWQTPEETKDYVMSHAQELSSEVAQAHIDLYVNEFTRNLGDRGYEAIENLLGRAMEQGLIPTFDLEKIRN
ncbi:MULTISPECIES: 1,4-dihydroxy-6-naphthoate synthase [Shouchella]|uniref:1,4-dihydroxy-6-naphtoate synthase n=2 Tax=Shouchella TaxID=2893057 RepID=A0ABY7W1E4_9BACI|nr:MULTISPECIES: 1,4-dihydroxy-6-naphthoate synthase [Shouchella]MED4126921.1 1,4-dihydroxy-6-naphthoate synthase [Shouchella miscanthi]WDF02508.1 1,4-dihydroxy-6-naphthoate synthase [Shouchella hunanensis]GAF20893.1 menaquinone via futalosine step 4 [Bacillus sp. JCM 19047]